MQVNSSKTVSSNPDATAQVVEQIISELKKADFSKDDLFAVHLALEEAFVNAVQHGNKMDSTKKINVNYMIDSDKVRISITDEGEGFNPSEVPDPRVGDNLYKTDGRGLLLMQSYMDEVKFNKQGNCVDMIKHKSNRASSFNKKRKTE